MMLGALPPVNDQEQWIKTVEEERNRFHKLQDKVSNPKQKYFISLLDTSLQNLKNLIITLNVVLRS